MRTHSACYDRNCNQLIDILSIGRTSNFLHLRREMVPLSLVPEKAAPPKPVAFFSQRNVDLTLASPQVVSLRDLGSCARLAVDEFSTSVFEEYIDYPLERQKKISAEKAVGDFEAAVTRTKDLITKCEDGVSPEVEIAFKNAEDSFNSIALIFNRGVVRYERRLSLYMKCSPLTRGILSPREGKQWDPWADDAASPRREEFAEMSFTVIVLAVFSSFLVGYLLSSYDIGKASSDHMQQPWSAVGASLHVKNVTKFSPISFLLRAGSFETNKVARRLNEKFWILRTSSSDLFQLVRQGKNIIKRATSRQLSGSVSINTALRNALKRLQNRKKHKEVALNLSATIICEERGHEKSKLVCSVLQPLMEDFPSIAVCCSDVLVRAGDDVLSLVRRNRIPNYVLP